MKTVNMQWEQNCNTKDWDLVSRVDSQGCALPPYRMRIHGYISLMHFGKHAGKWTAHLPHPYDEESDSDCEFLGAFTDLAEAMRAVEEAASEFNYL